MTSFILRLWLGEVALWKTYWLFGVGGGLVLGLPIFGGMLALTDVPDDATAAKFLAALGVLLIYVIWVCTGIWRAAGRFEGEKIWAILARATVVFEGIKVLVLVWGVVFPA